jgi:hypothetical protein
MAHVDVAPEGYGNISRTYFFGRDGSSVTESCPESAHILCHFGSMARGSYLEITSAVLRKVFRTGWGWRPF